MTTKDKLQNLISKENLEKNNLTYNSAIDSVVKYFKGTSQHGYFFATISIADSLNDLIKQGGKIEDRIIYGNYKTALEPDYTPDEVCLVFKEFSRISSLKTAGESSSCVFYDIDDDRNISFLGAFEGEKQGDEFVLKSILVNDIDQVLLFKDELKDLDSTSSVNM